jgi:CRISPR-associated protein Cas1
VTKDGKRVLQVPAMKVDQVVVFGNVQVTTPALAFLLRHGIDVAFLSSRGVFRGRLQPPHSRNIYLRRAQHARAVDPVFRLGLARAVVSAKIGNARTLCMRLERKGHAKDTDEIERRLQDLRDRTARASLDELRGIEGVAAGLYYSVLRSVLSDDLGFARRTRRPPRDPVNLLLGFAYTLLLNNVMAAIEIVGLDPYVGFYHAEKYGRPALALDMMEEFRPVVADALVLMLVNKRVIQAEDFTEEFGQIRLGAAGRRRVLHQWSEKVNDEIRHPIFDYRATYARCIELQVRVLSKVIAGELPEYVAFRTR